MTGQRRRGAARWVLAVAWRFVAGMHLDGRARSDATFLRRGAAVTGRPRWFSGRSGASWWARLAGWHRTTVRLAALLVLAGLWQARTLTEWALVLTLGPAAGLAAWRLVRAARTARHRRRVIQPLAAALATSLETSSAELAEVLTVPAVITPESKVTAPVPFHFQHTPQQMEAIGRITGRRLGGEWIARTHRDPLLLVVSRKPDPPGHVAFADVAELIRSQGGPMRILAGLAAGDEPVWLDFGGDLVNLGVSVGTGGGKSSFLRYVIAQFAYWGAADFPTFDTKFVSMDGMEDLPGLVVYRDTPDQWAALAGLRKDIDTRYRTLLADRTATFPTKVVLLEEQNDFAMEARAYWAEKKARQDPMTPPVYTDITRVMIKGRQVGYRVIGVYQRLTAAACGGIDAGVMRDAYGNKALARFGPNAWDSLTGLKPRAASSDIPGRWVIVRGGNDVRHVQVPYGEPAELIEFARSGRGTGTATPPAQPVTVPRDCPPAPSPAVAAAATVAAPVVVGLADAAKRLGMSDEAFKKARQRRPIEGEFRAEGDRPAWPADALDMWALSAPRSRTRLTVVRNIESA